MKKILFAVSAVALALSAGSAMAADLPSRKEAPIYFPPPPPPMWTGFYAGLNIGGGWGDDGGSTGYSAYYDPSIRDWLDAHCIWQTPPPPRPIGPANLFFIPTAIRSAPPAASLGGLQLGYNYQFGQFVIGVETDFQGTSISGGGNNARSAAHRVPLRRAWQRVPGSPRGPHRRQHQPVMVRHRARPRRLPYPADLADLRHRRLRLWSGGRLWL